MVWYGMVWTWTGDGPGPELDNFTLLNTSFNFKKSKQSFFKVDKMPSNQVIKSRVRMLSVRNDSY